MQNFNPFLLLNNICFVIGIAIVVLSCTGKEGDQKEIDLSGTWNFRMDEHDVGIHQNWFAEDLPETIELPGSMTINGKGNPVGPDTRWTGNTWLHYEEGKSWMDDENYRPYLSEDEFLYPFWPIADYYFTGAAWYQREVDIPEKWKGKSVELFLERCHWETQVWINENYLGLQNGLGVPHRYKLGQFLHPGKNKITICIDNRVKDIQVGDDAHSVSDNTQSNWNGIVGEIKLIRKDLLSIANVKIFPDVQNERAQIRVQLENRTSHPQTGKLRISTKSTADDSPQKIPTGDYEFTADDSTNTILIDYPMGRDVRLWDEFNPNLYELKVELISASNKDEHRVKFGMRDFKVEGKSFVCNGRPVFLRGTLECAIFPKTGFPPTDAEAWERIINICKQHGLNHIRFHSWCPPKAAFVAADKLGFYYQVEASAWAAVGDGESIDDWIYKESNAIVDAYGNHPSFVLMAYGNEPGGKNHVPYLTDYVNHWKQKDSRRLYTSGAGWPIIPENEFHSTHRGTRIQGWGQGLNSIINSQPPRSDYDWRENIENLNAPMVSHEIGQWCVYPNFKEIPKYDGVLKPKNFEIFKRSLETHGMLPLADRFVNASGKLQALCYKADIEAALRTPGYGGFQLLDLHDFPGQGTALVGVLDPFWDEKGYISPVEFRSFCNETVPLARFKKRTFSSEEKIEAEVEVAHYGPKELESILPSWKIVADDGQVIRNGQLSETSLPWGNCHKLGNISESISVEEASKFQLLIEVAGFVNSWDFWVYPSQLPEIGGDILVVNQLSVTAIEALNQGQKVLLSIEKGTLKDEMGGDIGIGFSSIFWNTAWTNGQKPHTLGLLCDPQHHALADFPTEYHSNWQWWDAMSHSHAISLESFATTPDPIVRVIDDWVTNRNLALIFEVKVGAGKLLVSGINLHNKISERLEAQQLLYSLKKYMESNAFNPRVELKAEDINRLFG